MNPSPVEVVSGHGGDLAVGVLREHGVRTMFTLSGGHVFPLYDAAVRSEPAIRLLDVRHEASAVFAAEALAKLTRRPGVAVLTAGPGVTNAISAITTASFNGSPVLVLAGRAPAGTWGSGALQELDHPRLLGPVTKSATTAARTAAIPAAVAEAIASATSAHRGPAFLDIPVDEVFATAEAPAAPVLTPAREDPDGAELTRIARLLDAAAAPVVVFGSDVWADGAETAATRFAETLRLPVIANGMGRGVLADDHDLLVTPARSAALADADLVLVVGTPLDFRLGYGHFAGDAQVIHLADSPAALARHRPLAASAAGDLSVLLDAIAAEAGAGSLAARGQRPGRDDWLSALQRDAAGRRAADRELMAATATPIHPARIYGELVARLDPDAVVIGDGGDFVSFAGRFLHPQRPGCWLDPGPYGCLGTGLGYAIGARIARPGAQVVVLLGDGAAGFSLMDVDTLVRHRLPVVMIVGNNGAWGLEKHPMRALYGYDVAADLAPQCRYDEVVRALGGAGELVTDPAGIGPALERAFAAGRPYLVNVVTDPEVAYPRSTVL